MTELQEIFTISTAKAEGGEMMHVDGLPFTELADDVNSVTFTLQWGPVKEKGVNGCQIDDVIRFARQFIDYHNRKFPCRENSLVITKLDEALLWLEERTRNRGLRGVEGTNQV